MKEIADKFQITEKKKISVESTIIEQNVLLASRLLQNFKILVMSKPLLFLHETY